MPKGKHLPRQSLPCANCGQTFSKVGSDIDRRHCSNSCAIVGRRKPIPTRRCLGCGILFQPTKRSGKYCYKGCVHVSASRRRHDNGIFKNARTAKEHLLGSARACQRCGWGAEPGILELHHKDRNRRNNHLSNLIVVCPNCHAVDHFQRKDGQFANNLGRV